MGGRRILIVVLPCECQAAADTGRPSVKTRFGRSTLDAAFLLGSADARRTLDDGFCLPDSPQAVAEVRTIGAGVCAQRARGWVGCAATCR